MSQSQTSNVFVQAIKSLIVASFKICIICISWVLKLLGITFTKASEVIEKIINKTA